MKHLLVAAVASVALACPMAYADEEVALQLAAGMEDPTMAIPTTAPAHQSGHHHKGQHAKRTHKHKRKHPGAKHHHHHQHAHKKHHKHHQMRKDDGKRQHGEQYEHETAAEKKIDQEIELNNR